MAINVLLTGSKFAAGLAGHSHALTADAVESLADVFSSLVVWRGLVVAAEPADRDHPYGHGKAEPIAAATVSVFLLAAAIWICARSVQALLNPHPTPAPYTLLVLGIAIVLKEGLFRFIRRESASIGSAAMHADAWHHRGDALTSLTAAIGISIALIGGEKYAAADDVAAVLAAGIIAWNGWRLLRRALNELMDRSPSEEMVQQIRHIAESTAGVERIEKCRVRKMGYEYYVDLHAEVDPKMTVARSHEIAHNVKDNVRGRIPSVSDVLVHIEPALGKKERSDGREGTDLKF
jgi:cation diffusion facilitator family transporter